VCGRRDDVFGIGQLEKNEKEPPRNSGGLGVRVADIDVLGFRTGTREPTLTSREGQDRRLEEASSKPRGGALGFGVQIKEASAGSDVVGGSVLRARPQQENTPDPLIVGKGFETSFPLHAAVQRWNNYWKEFSLLMFSCSGFLHGKTPHPYYTRDLFTSRVLRRSAVILH
jgi:hypothetical protein